LGWLSSKRSATASHLFVALPLALPASLTGIGLAYLGTRSPLDALTGTLWMPILASAIRFAPLAALFLASWRGRLDPSVFDAAKVHASPLLTFFRVLLPLSLPATVATFGLCFALSLGELGATLLVYPPGEATVTLRVYNLLHYGAAENVAGLCLSMVALTLVGGWLATCGLRKR
jgi:iron(III) transport system permease protein